MNGPEAEPVSGGAALTAVFAGVCEPPLPSLSPSASIGPNAALGSAVPTSCWRSVASKSLIEPPRPLMLDMSLSFLRCHASFAGAPRWMVSIGKEEIRKTGAIAVPKRNPAGILAFHRGRANEDRQKLPPSRSGFVQQIKRVNGSSCSAAGVCARLRERRLDPGHLLALGKTVCHLGHRRDFIAARSGRGRGGKGGVRPTLANAPYALLQPELHFFEI